MGDGGQSSVPVGGPRAARSHVSPVEDDPVIAIPVEQVDRLIRHLQTVAGRSTLTTYHEVSDAADIKPLDQLFVALKGIQAREQQFGCDLSALVVNRRTRRPGEGWRDHWTEEDWQEARDQCYAVIGTGPASPVAAVPATPDDTERREARVHALRSTFPDFARELDRAGRHVRSDPKAAAVALRVGVESLLREIAGADADGRSLSDLEDLLWNTFSVPVRKGIDDLRRLGNRASHPKGRRLTIAEVLQALEVALDVGEWAARWRASRDTRRVRQRPQA